MSPPKASAGGEGKTTKSDDRACSSLARASTLLLASLYACWTRELGILCNSNLQSSTKGHKIGWTSTKLSRKETTTRASNSTRWVRPRDRAKAKPSLRAQSSARTLEPLIQIPSEFLIRQPPPTFPGFPSEEPLEFSLNHPSGRGVHLIWIFTRFLSGLRQSTKA